MNKIIKAAFVSDLHYAAAPNSDPDRKGELIPKLLAGFIRKCNREIHPDFVLCGGDLIDDSLADDAHCLMSNLAEIFSLLDMPYCVIRGNHDLPQEQFVRYFPFQEIFDNGFVRILSFDDPELPEYNAMRIAADCAKTVRNLQNWHGVSFSFQHTPLLGAGKCMYQYENADALLSGLQMNHCRGTLSGHYHAGIPLYEENQMQFFVQSALCEAPFSFSVLHISMQGIQKIERM